MSEGGIIHADVAGYLLACHRFPPLGRLQPITECLALQGKLGDPLQLHRGLHRRDALGPLRDGVIERGLEPHIGVDHLCMLVVRLNSRAESQFAPFRRAQHARWGHHLTVTMPSVLSTCIDSA